MDLTVDRRAFLRAIRPHVALGVDVVRVELGADQSVKLVGYVGSRAASRTSVSACALASGAQGPACVGAAELWARLGQMRSVRVRLMDVAGALWVEAEGVRVRDGH